MTCKYHSTLQIIRDKSNGEPKRVECLTCRTSWSVVKGSVSLETFEGFDMDERIEDRPDTRRGP